MIPPSQLPSTDSLDGLTAATPDSDPTTLVCSATCGGVRCAPHCAQRFATARYYVTALTALFLLLGMVRGYLSGLVHLIGQLYGLPGVAIELLVLGADFVQGVSSLFVAHGGAGNHRPSWMGAPAFLHASACFAALVPFVMHGRAHSLPALNGTQEYLCELIAPVAAPPEPETCWITLAVLIIVQVTAGIAWSSLLTHGIAYLDDNVDSEDSPILFGAVLGADRLGPPIGMIIAFVCASKSGNIALGSEIRTFWWIGWPILGSVVLVVGVLISMFPKRLPSAAVRERANFILESVYRRVRIEEEPEVIDLPTGLFATMRRLLRNRVVGFLTLFLMFLYAPMHFFVHYENRYLESVYFIPEPEYSGGVLQDQWTSRVTTGFLKPPIVMLTMLLSGMIIARKRPRSQSLAIWNVVVACITAVIFFIFISLRCDVHINGLTDNKLEIDTLCNSDCSCPSNIPFLPVCDRYGISTYYSPCHAGCTDVEYIDDIKLYNNCKCLKYEKRAKGGACNYSNCTSKWVLFQTLGVLISTLVGTCVVGSVLMCLRSVAVQDKMHALAFVIMHIGATHLPGKYIYKWVTDATCIYWGGTSHCQLFDATSLAVWFNVLSGCLLLIAVVFGLLAWSHSKDIQLFKDNMDDPDTVEMNEIRQKLNARLATPYTRRRRNKDGSSSSDGEETASFVQGNVEEHELMYGENARTHPLQLRTEDSDDQQSVNVEQDPITLSLEPITEDNEIPQSVNDDQESDALPLRPRTEHYEVQQEGSEESDRRVWRATAV